MNIALFFVFISYVIFEGARELHSRRLQGRALVAERQAQPSFAETQVKGGLRVRFYPVAELKKVPLVGRSYDYKDSVEATMDEAPAVGEGDPYPSEEYKKSDVKRDYVVH